MASADVQTGEEPVVQVFNEGGKAPIVLVCEHASHHIPAAFENLGLSGAALTSHIAWDPGAFDVARNMARGLDAPLVFSTISRLVYDCNRPPEAEAAIPARSERYEIPGNRNLDVGERADRVARYYRPFEICLSEVLKHHPCDPALVTIHSFTPTYMGQRRKVELGILHDTDARLADALLSDVSGYLAARNTPYGPEDGVTHTLKRHALQRGLFNVMIEIRNDLIETDAHCTRIADDLCRMLRAALARLPAGQTEGAG